MFTRRARPSGPRRRTMSFPVVARAGWLVTWHQLTRDRAVARQTRENGACMASPGQESTARPVVAATGRWGEYTQLSRRSGRRAAGRRRGWYWVRIGLNLALLAAGWVGFVVLGESWWQLLTAAYLAVVATQLAFVGHDAGHRQIFRSRWANDLVGLVHANVLVGVSFDWCRQAQRPPHQPQPRGPGPRHQHHRLAFTADQARGGAGPAARPLPGLAVLPPAAAGRPPAPGQQQAILRPGRPTWSRGCWWPMSPAP